MSLKEALSLITLVFLTQSIILLLYVEHLHQTQRTNRKAWTGQKPTRNRSERWFHSNFLSKLLQESNDTRLTTWEIDFTLRIQKLIRFSVREINLQIRDEDCSTWWANPLSIDKILEESITSKIIKYKLFFEMQPGRIPFRTTVKLYSNIQKTPHYPDSLILIEGRRLDKLPNQCRTVPPTLRKICLCPEEKGKAEEKTKKARKEWAVNDPELVTWPPNVSMMVPDYMEYGTMDHYLKTPKERQNEFCGPSLKLMIFVSSSPTNFEGRKAIRHTFGNLTYLKRYEARLLFYFDKVSNPILQTVIDKEFELHDDIIQTNFEHSYHNLTLRYLSMFNWIVTHCGLQGSPMPPWILKTDDDYFINVPLALSSTAVNPKVEMMGLISCGQPVMRNTDFMEINYTPRYIYAPNVYPGYLSGASWLIRSDILTLLLEASLTVPALHIDDAYITGVLAREVGIRPRYLSLITYRRIKPGKCRTKRMINSNALSPKDIFLHWKYFKQPSDCKLNKNLLKVRRVTFKTHRNCFFH